MKSSWARALVGLAALAAVSGAARADDVAPADIEVARKILTSVGLVASIDEIVPAMLSQLQGQLLQIHPEFGKPLHETLIALLPEFQQGEAQVVTDVSRTLASKLNSDELKQTLAFCESEAGKKYTQAQAPVLESLASSGGLWREKLTQLMLERTRQEMAKKGFQF